MGIFSFITEAWDTVIHGRSDRRFNKDLENAQNKAKIDFDLRRKEDFLKQREELANLALQEKKQDLVEDYLVYAGYGIALIFAGVILIKLV